MSEQDKHNEIMRAIADINVKLNPMYESYMAWQTIRKWGKGLLWVAGAILGVIIAIKEILKK